VVDCKTVILVPYSAGQLGRKLREWGVYKYDSKNRPMDSVLAASEDDSVEHSLPKAPSTAVFHALSKEALTAVPESITGAHSRSLPDSNLRQLQNNTITANKRPPSPGGSSIHVKELSECPRAFDPLSSTEDGRTHHKHDARIVGSAQADLPSIEGPQYGSQPDVNMDRLSIFSLAPSSISGFASLRSLARRVRTPQTAQMSSDRKSVDDLPSGMMQWNKSSSHSLRLFGLFPSRLSVTSSAMTDNSQMSWKPEVPAIIPEDGEVPDRGFLLRFKQPKRVCASTIPIGWSADDLRSLANTMRDVSAFWQSCQSAPFDLSWSSQSFEYIASNLEILSDVLDMSGWPRYDGAPELKGDLEDAKAFFDRFKPPNTALYEDSLSKRAQMLGIDENLKGHIRKINEFKEWVIR
jgi:hypothetical protein